MQISDIEFRKLDHKETALQALSSYLLGNTDGVASLPIDKSVPNAVKLPVQLVSVSLPEWAESVGVEGSILVPIEAGEGRCWETVNWWYVICWYVHCFAEREHEARFGAIHSYSFKLEGWDERMWERAWVNRIAMFLIRWAARSGTEHEVQLAPASILLTHDLDAISKTTQIRIKQCAFNAFNAVRALKTFDLRQFANNVVKSFQSLFMNVDYRLFRKVYLDRNNTLVTRQIINVYAGQLKGRSFKSWLIDPSYDIDNPKLVDELKGMQEKGVEIGLHQSFLSWNSKPIMGNEVRKLGNAFGQDITTSRQHWLRFSFADTWKVQRALGLREDTTLGFNDRLGFRNGAALSFSPLLDDDTSAKSFKSVPMVLMDSHLYDYEQLDDEQRLSKIDGIVSEIEQVRGTASLIWHPHTLAPDYGWEAGYTALKERLLDHGCK